MGTWLCIPNSIQSFKKVRENNAVSVLHLVLGCPVQLEGATVFSRTNAGTQAGQSEAAVANKLEWEPLLGRMTTLQGQLH